MNSKEKYIIRIVNYFLMAYPIKYYIANSGVDLTICSKDVYDHKQFSTFASSIMLVTHSEKWSGEIGNHREISHIVGRTVTRVSYSQSHAVAHSHR